MRPATVGEQVFVLLDPTENNGSSVSPAWVVNAWSTPGGGESVRQEVNLRVLSDSPSCLWLTSVDLFDQTPPPETLARLYPLNPMGYRVAAFRNHVMF